MNWTWLSWVSGACADAAVTLNSPSHHPHPRPLYPIVIHLLLSTFPPFTLWLSPPFQYFPLLHPIFFYYYLFPTFFSLPFLHLTPWLPPPYQYFPPLYWPIFHLSTYLISSPLAPLHLSSLTFIFLSVFSSPIFYLFLLISAPYHVLPYSYSHHFFFLFSFNLFLYILPPIFYFIHLLVLFFFYLHFLLHFRHAIYFFLITPFFFIISLHCLYFTFFFPFMLRDLFLPPPLPLPSHPLR